MRSITTLIILAMVIGFAGSGTAQESAPRITLISNVNVFDGKSDELQKNMHVLVKGNLIESISSEPLAVIQTDNVKVIDGGGRTLMPVSSICTGIRPTQIFRCR